MYVSAHREKHYKDPDVPRPSLGWLKLRVGPQVVFPESHQTQSRKLKLLFLKYADYDLLSPAPELKGEYWCWAVSGQWPHVHQETHLLFPSLERETLVHCAELSALNLARVILMNSFTCLF